MLTASHWQLVPQIFCNRAIMHSLNHHNHAQAYRALTGMPSLYRSSRSSNEPYVRFCCWKNRCTVHCPHCSKLTLSPEMFLKTPTSFTQAKTTRLHSSCNINGYSKVRVLCLEFSSWWHVPCTFFIAASKISAKERQFTDTQTGLNIP